MRENLLVWPCTMKNLSWRLEISQVVLLSGMILSIRLDQSKLFITGTHFLSAPFVSQVKVQYFISPLVSVLYNYIKICSILPSRWVLVQWWIRESHGQVETWHVHQTVLAAYGLFDKVYCQRPGQCLHRNFSFGQR